MGRQSSQGLGKQGSQGSQGGLGKQGSQGSQGGDQQLCHASFAINLVPSSSLSGLPHPQQQPHSAFPSTPSDSPHTHASFSLDVQGSPPPHPSTPTLRALNHNCPRELPNSQHSSRVGPKNGFGSVGCGSEASFALDMFGNQLSVHSRNSQDGVSGRPNSQVGF